MTTLDWIAAILVLAGLSAYASWALVGLLGPIAEWEEEA